MNTAPTGTPIVLGAYSAPHFANPFSFGTPEGLAPPPNPSVQATIWAHASDATTPFRSLWKRTTSVLTRAG